MQNMAALDLIEPSVWTVLAVAACGLLGSLWGLGRIRGAWRPSAGEHQPQAILCNAPSRVARFRMGCSGNVKGIMLDTGVFARTPPAISATLIASIPPQAKVVVSGYVRRSRDGETVIDAVLIIVDGEPGGNQPGSRPYSRIFS
jgi:hypothetical protein